MPPDTKKSGCEKNLRISRKFSETARISGVKATPTLTKLSDTPPHNSQPATNHRFEALSECSPDIILEITADGTISYANPQSVKMLSVPPDTIVGKNPSEIGLPDGFCAFLKTIATSTLRTGHNIERDYEFITPDRDPVSIIASIRDRTDRHRREAELEAASQRLMLHASNSPLAVVEFDQDGRCTTWNHRAEELFGPRPDSVLWIWSAVIHPDDRPRFEEVYERLHSGSDASAFVSARFTARDGSTVYGEWHLSCLFDSDGRPASVLCFVNDSTARVKAETALQQSKEQLEETVANRTSQLRKTTERLQNEIEVRRRLERDLIEISEREHRRIGQDLHDGVCQELAGIRFSIEAMSKSRASAKVLSKQLAEVAAAASRAVHHTRLISRGLAPLVLESVEISDALEELAANSSTLFKTKCSFAAKGPVPKLGLERSTNLYRIAQECIQNAIKHGGATRIRILLDCSGSKGILAVTDNGTGLPESAAPNGAHTGMGLKIMGHRAEILRGTVSFLSPKEGGLCVHCVFEKP
jgi:PAS domain S-box-containing protein